MQQMHHFFKIELQINSKIHNAPTSKIQMKQVRYFHKI